MTGLLSTQILSVTFHEYFFLVILIHNILVYLENLAP